MYHEGNRVLQRKFGSTDLADRLLQVTHHTTFNKHDQSFIESAAFFFLATADSSGQPDCSFKGGAVGFVRVTSSNELIFPDYDGNGMFKSLGNITANPQVGLLFITMEARPKRLRVNGRAEVILESPLMPEFSGAQLLVKVTAEHIFPNCPRYIPNIEAGQPSEYIPQANQAPLEPEWKSFDIFKDAVPPRHK